MSRIPPVPAADLGPLRATVERIEAFCGFSPNSLLIMAHRPRLAEAFTTFATSITLTDDSVIDEQLRWMVAHVSSRASGCRYCQAHTAHFGHERGGIPEPKVAALWEFESSELFSPAERAALRLAAAAGSVPNETTDQHFEELRDHFSDEQIVEMVGVISLFGFLNRWNDTLATQLEGPPASFASEHLAPSGWELGVHA